MSGARKLVLFAVVAVLAIPAAALAADGAGVVSLDAIADCAWCPFC